MQITLSLTKGEINMSDIASAWFAIGLDLTMIIYPIWVI
jgi:hypothetical protein